MKRLASELRLLGAIELFLHASDYERHPALSDACAHPDASLSSDSYQISLLSDHGVTEFSRGTHFEEAIRAQAEQTCVNKTSSTLINLMALVTVTNRPIFSVYPEANAAFRPLYHTCILPLQEYGIGKAREDTLYIMWSRDGDLDTSSGTTYTPNHFTPLIQTHENDPFEDEWTSEEKANVAADDTAERKAEKADAAVDVTIERREEKAYVAADVTIERREENDDVTDDAAIERREEKVNVAVDDTVEMREEKVNVAVDDTVEMSEEKANVAVDDTLD